MEEPKYVNKIKAMDPTRLRDALLEAAASGDHGRLASLCSSQTAVITKHFAEWRQPDGIQADDPIWETRIGGLYAVAKVFANHLNNIDLLQSLLNDGQSSEIAEWERKLSAAMRLMRDFQYDKAISILTNQLIDARKLAGHGHLHLSGTTHWYLSQCHLMRRDQPQAVAHGERSLEITQRINDDPKYIQRYLQHLYQAHRYFGDTAEAAKYAGLTAEFLANTDVDRARLFRTQATLLSGPGEPLTRVVAWVGIARYEVDEVPILKDAKLNLVIERNRISLQPADVLVQQGQAARDEGRVDDALALFRQGHLADPYDPDPLINQAFLLAFAERYFESIERFEEVEQLAPGWPSSRTGLWFVQRILAGEYPLEVLSIATGLSGSGPEDPEKLALTRKSIGRFPDLSAFWLEHAQCLRASGSLEETQSALRRGLERRGDVDTRTRLLLELGQATKDDEREGLLHQAIVLNGNLVAAAVAKLMLRQPIGETV